MLHCTYHLNIKAMPSNCTVCGWRSILTDKSANHFCQPLSARRNSHKSKGQYRSCRARLSVSVGGGGGRFFGWGFILGLSVGRGRAWLGWLPDLGLPMATCYRKFEHEHQLANTLKTIEKDKSTVNVNVKASRCCSIQPRAEDVLGVGSLGGGS